MQKWCVRDKAEKPAEESYDVVVVGGGPSGIAAAVQSARMGAKTLLIERYGTLGGNLTLGYVGPLLGDVSPGTITEEVEACFNLKKDVCCDFEQAKYALVKFVGDHPIHVYLQTQLIEAVTENKRIQHILVAGKQGEQIVRANIYIDATGDGDLAYYAGCPYEIGRESDGLVQPTTLMFTIEGIDPGQSLTCGHEEDDTLLSNGKSYLQLCHDACASGELPPSVNIVRLYPSRHPGERMVNATQANRINGTAVDDLFRAERELREQMQTCCAFLRRNVPGFENIIIKASASTLGVRETRRIIGDYILSDNDVLNGRTHSDVAVHRANFPMDIHNPSGGGQAERDGCPHTVQPYDIPFSTMRPLGVDNLFTAGRCISGTHRAHASYRVMRICMAMGQAAGAAAAMASQAGKSTRELDYGAVQKYLIDSGVVLFD